MQFTLRWLRYAFINLFILAGVGLLLRAKIVFPMPWVDHKHLLHAHSHFAFAGWVTLALYTCIIHFIEPGSERLKQYERLLWAQQLSAFGMLATFPWMGYAAPSIAFSTFSILVSYTFSLYAWKDISRSGISKAAIPWLYTGIICLVLSSLGTFSLVWLMASRMLQQQLYFGSVYFYLHFQYNGWFLFGIGGLLMAAYADKMKAETLKQMQRIFLLLLITVIPAWLLSLLWMRLPKWIYYPAAVAALLQLLILPPVLRSYNALKEAISQNGSHMLNWLWLGSLLSFCLKILLQALSAIPFLNKYAFGIRPVVIGFLHLVLLGFVTLFLLGMGYAHKTIGKHYLSRFGTLIFVAGIVLNEIILMTQGFAAILDSDIASAKYLLLVTALIMFSGVGLIVLSFTQKKGAL